MIEYYSLPRYVEHIKEVICKNLRDKFPRFDGSGSEIKLERPPDIKLGDFSCACFPFAGILKTNPAAIAASLANDFQADGTILEVKNVGPYLNIHVNADVFVKSVCLTIFDEGDDFGRTDIGRGERVMVEYSSPNTNKPLHIGHLRNNFIGMSLANVLQFSGFDVVKANLVNDRGIHICKSMLAYQKWGKAVTPRIAKKKGDHLVGEFYVLFEEALKKERCEYARERGVDLVMFDKNHLQELKQKIRDAKSKHDKEELKRELQQLNREAQEFEHDFLGHSQYYQEAMEMLQRWEQGEREVEHLWKKMNGWVMKGFEDTYRTLGCEFDKFYWESETYTLGRHYVEKGLEEGVFYRKENGSIWISAEKLRQTCPEVFRGLPLKDKLLLRADGTSVYITQDIGTAVLKAQDYRLDRSIYVVASEQSLHFKILFAILKTLGFPWADGCYHAAYGMVTLPRGMGKIKSREGTAVDADELIEEMRKRAAEKMKQENLRVPRKMVRQTSLEIALAAVKMYLMQVSMEKDIHFDPNKTIEFNGDTGPAVQYSYARICSIFRKATESGIQMPDAGEVEYGEVNSPDEIELVHRLCEFPEIVALAARNYNVSVLANYLLTLTRTYARVYTLYPVLRAETKGLRDARLVLAKAAAQVIENGMRLLGICVPEIM